MIRTAARLPIGCSFWLTSCQYYSRGHGKEKAVKVAHGREAEGRRATAPSTATRLLIGSQTADLPGGFPQPIHIADRWYAEELFVFPVKV